MNTIKLTTAVFGLLFTVLTFVSCGNSSERDAAKEQARQDSIAEAHVKMEQAKEEARRRAAEDSTQQSEAVQASE